MRYLLLTLLLVPLGLLAQMPSVHDPVLIKQDSVYYLFCTGNGISRWSSTDMVNWKREKPVFDTPPQWAVEAVPGYKGHTWAPDISFHNGTYYLFYSVSTFGKNSSCIGLATATSLHPGALFTDHGKVIRSVQGKDNWNAIDPNLIFDKKDKPWLSFGSFWGGLQLVRLNDSLTAPVGPFINIASRERGNKAIEAPFIFQKGNYYYLFASTDFCCKGVNSTYKMVVGRSRNLQGPYTDKAGVDMKQGGGTLLLEGDEKWHGVGHNSVYTFDGHDYLFFHGYDANDRGRSKLRIEKLTWNKGWPEISR
ncbi:family 43 glycosylhydrolase [uncultured Chitinophaga sp.]|uniref:family 43 glycosylhydrolase n=1 Tax=uncultured Chitinophaga sp. TaxID=339340 RepID=UPI0025DDA526|nr:family 43 glycosylhydrolase [uncultured Chitinophaga sp.]